MRAKPATLLWFAQHELRLNWRDFAGMMTGGKRIRAYLLVAGASVFALMAHLVADFLVTPWAAGGVDNKQSLVMLTGTGLLFFSLMLSQTMESVTRAFYARADLDLLLSSPASSRRVFAVRTGAIAVTTFALSALLGGPAINMLAIREGPGWLAAYLVLAALSAFATALAVVFTLVLFRLAGPKRTRLLAQIAAAVVGAGFVIGIQAAAILAYGNLSRWSVFQSDALVDVAPGTSHPIWLPARAATGDLSALAPVLFLGLSALALVIAMTSGSFGRHAIAAFSVATERQRQQATDSGFRPMSPKQALRLKEWRLLARDPWLISQTLMQILYLVPPALLLWLNFGEDAGIFVIVVPVLVMASGQLAGGLAWLAVSGEDARDLVVTAPVAPGAVLAAKVEAILAVIAAILTPLLLAMGLMSWQAAAATAGGAAFASASATLIQIWFRTNARRSQFRRRQTSSRMATIAEAFSSISWAAAAGLALAGSWFAPFAAGFAVLVLVAANAVSPGRRQERR